MQQKIFLIKKSNGIIYNFYTSATGGICYKIYSLHNNQKVDPFEISVTDEKILEFFVTIDDQDHIYILCLTTNGDLKYFINRDNMWHSKIFSHFDLRSNIIKSLFIHIANKKIYILYAASNVMNVNLWTIYFKAWDGSKWNNLNIGMTICDKELSPYYAAIDTQNNIHIVYKNSGNRGTQIFYRKFHEQFALWTSPDKVVNSPDIIGFYYIFCSSNNDLHLSWAVAAGNSFKLLYKKLNTKVLNTKHYDRSLTLATSNQPYLQPVIFEIEKIVSVMWKSAGEFFASEINATGLSCENTSSVPCTNINSTIMVELKNNYVIEKQSFNGCLLYGIPGDFIDLVLPKWHSCDVMEEVVPEDTFQVEPDPFVPVNENPPQQPSPPTVTPISPFQEQNTASQVQTPNNNLPSTIETEILSEITSSNKQILTMLEDVKKQLNRQSFFEILHEIKTLNELLREVIDKTLKEQVITKEIENLEEPQPRKLFGFFKRD